MNATNHFLDLVQQREREAGRSGSNYSLAKILRCKAPFVYDYRAGRRHLSESHCIAVAHYLDVDPLHVLAAVNEDRTDNPEAKKIWHRAAAGAWRAAALALSLTLTQLGVAPRAEAVEGPVRVNAPFDVLYNAHTVRA